MSVKFILDSSHHRASAGALNTDGDVRVRIDTANRILASAGRGYQLQLVEIFEVVGASEWFEVETHDLGQKIALESAAKEDPARYGFRNDAINIYVVGTADSAMSSYPFTGDIILMGRSSGEIVFIHEIGHYMGLGHTQGFTCGACVNKILDVDVSCSNPGDDFIADTLPDLACWDTQDAIAQYSYHKDYADLSAADRGRVDDVFYNVMSYHKTQKTLTNDQLDRWTDAANSPRSNVVTGRTWFVDSSSRCAIHDGSSDCSLDVVNLGGPFERVIDAVAKAGAQHIVLLRGGNYSGAIRFDRALTLRATRGNALLGGR